MSRVSIYFYLFLFDNIIDLYYIFYMKKKVNITLDDVLDSLEIGCAEITRYLNTETGGIAMISREVDSFDENGESLDYDDLDKFCDEKYLVLPIVDSREGFRDMEAFAETIKDFALRNRLKNVLKQRRPFRRFREELQIIDELQNWYKFQTLRNHGRALDWLEENNIEAVGKSGSYHE